MNLKLPRLTYSLPKKFPMDSFPEELLSETFIRWADVDEDAPWMATMVCRRWYTTVLSCSRAWSKVHVHYKGRTKKEDEDPEWCVEEEDDDPRGKPRSLSLWLARAGTAELNVSVTIGRITPGVETIYNMIRQLEHHVPKLREFKLIVDSCLFADALLGMLWRQPPALLHLVIACSHTDDQAALFKLWDMLDGAPSMRSLKLVGCIPPPLPERSPSPHHLRTLFLEDLRVTNLNDILDGLEACRSLENLTIIRGNIRNQRPYPAPPPNMPPRIGFLPALTYLRIHDIRSRNLEKLISHIATPKLKTLSLQNLMPYRDLLACLDGDLGMNSVTENLKNLGNVLVEFVGRGTEIQQLTLECSHIQDESFLQLLQLLPNLAELHLIDSLTGTPVLVGLTDLNGDTIRLCPNLRTLEFHSCAIITGKILIDLVHSRNRPDTLQHITTLDIQQCKMVHQSHIRTLKNIDPERLQIHYNR